MDFLQNLKIPQKAKAKIQDKVGEFLIERTLEAVGKGTSPIKGESWQRSLTPKYRNRKKQFSSKLFANMELKGETLDALKFNKTKNGVEIGIFGKPAWKADGHNKLSGATNKTLKEKRRYIPGKGQKYDADIERGVEDIIAESAVERAKFKRSDFSGVSTQKDLFSKLKNKTGLEGTKKEISRTVLREPELVDILDELGILNLLDVGDG